MPASTDLPETHEESFSTPPKPSETSSPGEHGSFAGQVLSTAGDPIAGAEVNFVRQGKAFSTVSDDGGHFFFDAPAAGSYALVAVFAADYLPFEPPVGQSGIAFTALPGKAVEGVRLYLSPALHVFGIVVDSNDAPVPGAQIRVYRDDEATAMATLAHSNERGLFHLRASQGAMVEASHPQHGDAIAFVKRQTAEDAPLRLRLDGTALRSRVERGTQKIRGTVTDGAGKPVAGAELSASDANDWRHTENAVSDVHGRFAFNTLLPGVYDVRARAHGFVPHIVRGVPTDGERMLVVLVQGAVLRGHVHDAASGEPVPAFTVTVRAQAWPEHDEGFQNQSVVHVDGAYAVAGLPAGTYRVDVQAVGYGSASQQDVAVALDRDTVVDLLLTRGLPIEGLVSDASTGRPVPGAEVSTERGGAGGVLTPELRARTDDAGHFTLNGLATGRHSITVDANGYMQRMVAGIELSANQAAEPLAIALTPGPSNTLQMVAVGLVVTQVPGGLGVRVVMPNGGASQAGVRVDDIIARIDGYDVTKGTFAQAMERLRGPEGTVTVLALLREGTETELSVVRREMILDD